MKRMEQAPPSPGTPLLSSTVLLKSIRAKLLLLSNVFLDKLSEETHKFKHSHLLALSWSILSEQANLL